MPETVLSILQELFEGDYKAKRGEFWVYCPKCHHHKPKLVIDLNSGKYHCWVCSLGGKNIYGLLNYINADRIYYGRIKTAMSNIGVYSSDNIKYTCNNSIITLPKEFKPISVKNNSLERRRALIYLKNRGFNAIDIFRYNIGYADSGEYSDRIIIPSYNDIGKLNYFVTRSYYDIQMKYKNPAAAKTELIIFELFINFNYPIVLTEGVFDAIAIKINAIPLLGKYLSNRLLNKLYKHKPKVYICLDPDAKEQAVDIHTRLINEGLESYIVDLPNNTDPAELGTNKVWKYINASENNADSGFLTKIKSMLGV